MLKNNRKDPQQWEVASNGSWHDLENKVIAQRPIVLETFHLQALCRKVKKLAMKKKSDLYPKNWSVQPRKTVWGWHPPQVRASDNQCDFPPRLKVNGSGYNGHQRSTEFILGFEISADNFRTNIDTGKLLTLLRFFRTELCLHCLKACKPNN